MSRDVVDAVDALKGETYSFDLVNALSKKIEAESWLAESPLSYSDIAIENCDPAGKLLDVSFTVFSAQVSPALSIPVEWRVKARSMPHEASGNSKPNAPVLFSPEAGFDPARRFFAGGRARAAWNAKRSPFRSLDVRGTGSTNSHALSAALAGELDSATAWLSHAEWRLGFQDAATPADNIQLKDSRLGFQFTGSSKPVNGVVMRFGGTLDGGTMHSGFAKADLAAGALANSRFTSAKLYGGVAASGHNQTVAVSYSLGLGATSRAFRGDWRKHIGDVAHELWLPFGDHRLFEVEQRFTAGGIQTLHAIPAAERFFGGNLETSLIAGDNWRIRSAPVIRSIPTNRLYRTAQGAGADQFFSYNSTTAVTAYRRPIVPRELLADDSFKKKLKGAITSQASILEIAFKSDDKHFTSIRDRLPNVAAKLADLKAAKIAALAIAPASLKDDLDTCSDAVASAALAVKHAREDKRVPAFGWVVEMLPDGDNALSDVVSACGASLVTKLKAVSIPTGDIETAVSDLSAAASQIQTEFANISVKKAHQKAEADVSYISRTLKIITEQMNVTSISPVFLFDAARIGSSNGPLARVRYGVGGGVRLTLASTASFTVGYAANPNRRLGEGSGAFVFSLTTRNLFE